MASDPATTTTFAVHGPSAAGALATLPGQDMFVSTTNGDGNVCFWPSALPKSEADKVGDDIELSHEPHCLAVSPDGQSVAVGSEEGRVQLYAAAPKKPAAGAAESGIDDREGELILRFQSRGVNDLAYSHDGAYLVACGADPEVRVRRVKDGKEVAYEEHDGGARAVACDPRGEFVATCGTDGKVHVWNVPADFDPVLVERQHDCDALKTTFPEAAAARMAWSPSGAFLALPGASDVRLLSRDAEWKDEYLTGHPGMAHTDDIALVAWSPDGRHLATAGLDMRVIIWDFATQKAPIWSKTMAAATHSILWVAPPTGVGAAALVVLDARGELHTVTDVATPPAAAAAAAAPAAEAAEAAEVQPKKLGSRLHKTAAAGDDDDDDDDFWSGDADAAAAAAPAAAAAAAPTADDAADEDMDAADAAADEEEDDAYAAATSWSSKPAAPVLQATLQPGATPLTADGSQHRYLCWNSVGAVVSCQMSDHNTIKFLLSDTSAHRPATITEYEHYDLAALSPTAACFAMTERETADEDEVVEAEVNGVKLSVPEKKTEYVTSKIMYKAFDSWAFNTDWEICLPKNESSVAVAAGVGWAAVATTTGNLRIFTHGSLQKDVLELPGKVLAMAGQEDLLAVVTHEAPAGGCQRTQFVLFDVEQQRELASCQLPLNGEGTTLRWLGFSDKNVPMALTSTGKLLAMTTAWGTKWQVVLDTFADRKSSDDSYWPVKVVGDTLVAVMLKGGTRHPTFPMPIVSSLPLAPALVKTAVPSAERALELQWVQQRRNMEQAAWAADLEMPDADAELHACTVAADKTALRLLGAALSTEPQRQQRALECAASLKLRESLTVAVKIADGAAAGTLAGRIEAIAHERDEAEADSDDEFDGGAPARAAPRAAVRRPDEFAVSREYASADEDEDDDLLADDAVVEVPHHAKKKPVSDFEAKFSSPVKPPPNPVSGEKRAELRATWNAKNRSDVSPEKKRGMSVFGALSSALAPSPVPLAKRLKK